MTNIESETACRDLVLRCLRALDARDYETLACGFATDGVWDRSGELLEGPDAVRAAMAKRPADLETQHLACNMIVDLESTDSAVVHYTIAAYAQMKDRPYHLHGMFRATDRLIRTSAGWRFAHRSVVPAFGVQESPAA